LDPKANTPLLEIRACFDRPSSLTVGGDLGPRRILRVCPADTLGGGRWRFLAVGTLNFLEFSREPYWFKSPCSHFNFAGV